MKLFIFSSYFCNTVYSEAELRLLATLRGERALSDLADDLDRSLSYVSELVTQMEEKNLLHTVRSGKTRRVRRSQTKAIELFDRFVLRYPHIPFPELLDGATLRVLYYLDTPATATELADSAEVHRSTVHRSLSPLQHRVLVYRTNGKYALNDEFEELATVAREFAHHRHRNRIENHADAYTILWESLDEFLIQTDEEIDAEPFLPTGPERFPEYGLPLLARQRRHYLYSESKTDLSASELCCHMIVIDQGARSQSYCLLLIAATDIDREEVQSLAKRYDVEEMISDLLTYLDTEGEVRADSLPGWTEFEKLASEYEVDV